MKTTALLTAHHQPPPIGKPGRPRAARRGRARRVILWFMALFVASQATLALLSTVRPELRDPQFYDKFDALNQLRMEKRPTQCVVAFGSSRTFYGIDALRLEQRLEFKHSEPVLVYNFGQFSAGPRLNSLYLHRLVAHECRPDVVLLEVLPPLLAQKAENGYERHFVAPRRFLREELQRAARYGWPHAELETEWLGTVLAPAAYLRLPLGGRFAPWLFPPNVREDGCRRTDVRGSSWIDNGRASPTARAEGVARTRSEYAAILGPDFQISSTARLALADSIELCRREGIGVVLYLPPEAPSFQALYAPEASQAIMVFLHELCGRNGVALVDGRNWLGEEEFIDGHHPLRTGARLASERLGTNVSLVQWLRRPDPK